MSFPSFRLLYKDQNWKLGNLGNFQLSPVKQLQDLKKFLSFPSFRLLYKGQNQKLGNLGNFHFPLAKQLQVLKQFPSFPSFWFLYKGQNWKPGKLGSIYNTCKFQGMCFTWGSWKFPRFLSLRFWPLYWNRKLGKLGNFVLSEFVLFEEVRNF